MSDLQSVIQSTQKELEKLQKEREKANVKDYATIDKEILRLRFRIQRLTESERLQQKQGNEPTDRFTQAKIFVTETVNRVSEQVKEQGEDQHLDMNTDRRMIAMTRLTDIIDRLELLKMASEITDSPGFPDDREFIAPFESYVTAKKERIDKARKEIQDIESEIEHTKALLQESTSAGNPEEIIAYSDQLETAKKTREYLLPMLQAQEQSEALPQGIIKQAWKETCDLYRHEFALRLEIIKTAQEIHKTACSELIEFDNLLKQARYKLQDFAKENDSPDQIVQYNQQITSDLDMSWLRQRPANDNEKVYNKVHFNRDQSL